MAFQIDISNEQFKSISDGISNVRFTVAFQNAFECGNSELHFNVTRQRHFPAA